MSGQYLNSLTLLAVGALPIYPGVYESVGRNYSTSTVLSISTGKDA